MQASLLKEIWLDQQSHYVYFLYNICENFPLNHYRVVELHQAEADCCIDRHVKTHEWIIFTDVFYVVE